MKCKCGFEFTDGVGANSVFVISICPDCGKHYKQSDTGDIVEIPPIEEVSKITEVDVIDTICELNKQIERGQFVMGRNKASLELDLSPQQYRTALKYLKNSKRITIKTTNKFSVISIENWESYQLEQNSNQPANQPVTTYNNVKNVKNVKKDYPPNSIEVRMSVLLGNLILERKPDYQDVLKAKKDGWQKWAAHVDRMIRLDKRLPERIEQVIRWCQKDDFWQNNILSTEKLRKQFDKLEMKKDGQKPTSKTRRSLAAKDSNDVKSAYGTEIQTGEVSSVPEAQAADII